jgi:hypothetical protein
MARFMRNGVIHEAIYEAREYFIHPTDDKFVGVDMTGSQPEEGSEEAVTQFTETPTEFIEWLPSSIGEIHSEWILGMSNRGEK